METQDERTKRLRREASARYREGNKDKERQRKAQWYAENREKVIAKTQQYHQEKREEGFSELAPHIGCGLTVLPS